MQKIYFVICKSGVDFMFFKKIFLFKFNIYIKSVVTGFLIFILILFVNFCSHCNKIRNKTLRLHVIANSDSVEDQNLKLKIRDLIITNFKLKKFESLEETKKFAIQNLPEIKKIAQDEIFKNGFNYPVYVKICKDSFNTRTYENISLPAGEYDALKIIIGDGKGKNWWCVMFPPMCIPAAEDCNINKNIYNNNFSQDEKNILENKKNYKIKFKIVEIYESCHNSLSKFAKNLRNKFK